MKTIQLEISDQEYENLLTESGKNTGIKAVKFMIEKYHVYKELYLQTNGKYQHLEIVHTTLRKAIKDREEADAYIKKEMLDYKE